MNLKQNLTWLLISRDGLHHLATTSSPREYDEILNDLSGKRIIAYREKGKVIDTYQDHRFYGWCKRFPPSQRGGYSIIGFRSLFSFLRRNIPQKVSEYDFPLMPHNCSCGEWKEGTWVADSLVNTDQMPNHKLEKDIVNSRPSTFRYMEKK